ncbi:MAG: ankyrin repeat domain-containing protein [Parvularculales bacterium]
MKSIIIICSIFLLALTPVSLHAQENVLLESEFWETATIEDVETAIRDGADVNESIACIQCTDDEWFNITPLHLAVDVGSPEAINVLLEHGANVEAHDNYGWTPMYWAVKKAQRQRKYCSIMVLI